MRRPTLSPSIIAADFLRLGEELAFLNKHDIEWLHIDLMDGHFVPNISLGFPALEALSKVARAPLEVHMMMNGAEAYFSRIQALGAARISVHVEVYPSPTEVLKKIRAIGCQAGLALNPGTDVSCLSALFPWLDAVLLMSVSPGFSGQPFIQETIPKVEQAVALREQAGSRAQIIVDGGVGLEVLPALKQAGADVLVVGDALFGLQDRQAFVNGFQSK